MTLRQVKAGYFAIEAVNSISSAFFLNYLYFFMREQFGFGNAGNLLLTALHGFVYIPAAWAGGRFAQHRGYFAAVRFGLITTTVALALAGLAPALGAQFIAVAVWTFGLAFIWPALEALASERESALGMQRMVGIYNIVWSGAAALAYFTGGAIIERLGWAALFWVPIALNLSQLALLEFLARVARSATSPAPAPELDPSIPGNPRPIAKARTFLRLAVIANPFAYLAINALLPIIPRLADRLELSKTYAGIFISTWFFARLAGFVILSLWTGWHYRFSWLAAAFAGMIAGYGCILLAPNLWLVLAAQIVFGLAVGLIYYSSLFYSMDAGEAKGEHGGIHEAAIGAGILGGPIVGLAAIHFFPAAQQPVPVAICALLACGFAVTIGIYRKGRKGF